MNYREEELTDSSCSQQQDVIEKLMVAIWTAAVEDYNTEIKTTGQEPVLIGPGKQWDTKDAFIEERIRGWMHDEDIEQLTHRRLFVRIPMLFRWLQQLLRLFQTTLKHALKHRQK